MPDDRLDRTRRSLPPGYQFGDARWRAPHENAAERLAIHARGVDRCRPVTLRPVTFDCGGWNSIEVEPD